MPISATGARRRRDAGFTLVEVMVALFVMGLAAGAILLNLPPPGPRLSDEAERLAARLRNAQQEAVLTNRDVEVVITPQGCGFRVRRQGRWTPLDTGAFESRPWAEGLSVRVQGGEGVEAVRFDSTGGAEPAAIRLSAGGRSVGVAVDPQGHVRIHDPG